MLITKTRLKEIIKEEIYSLSETGEIQKAAVDAALSESA